MATDFQQRVHDAVRAIPRGEARTYGDIAHAVGSPRASQAVGQTLLPLTWDDNRGVPFWRVVLSDGSVNTAAAETEWPEAVARHRRMLHEEGVAFTDDGRVASIAQRQRAAGRDGGGARASKRKPIREASPCGDPHMKVQWTCRDCNPAAR